MEERNRRDFFKASAALIAAGLPPAVRAAQEASGGSLLRLPRDVRVGIIGFEGHYSEILSVTSASAQVKVTAVADGDADLRSRAASSKAVKGARIYADYREMLQKEELDVVAVCGANGPRAAILRACADRRLAIIAEKPLATTMADLLAVRRSVEANRVAMTILLPMRLSPHYRAMHSLVRSGRIGEVVAMAAQKSYKLGSRPDWMKRRATFGGTIPYIGIHMVDLMRWISGREFVETAAFESNVGFPDYGDMANNAAVIFKLDNQGTATVRLDYLRPGTAPTHGDDRLRLAGTKGVLEYQEATGLRLITQEKGLEQIRDLPPEGSLFADFLDALCNGKKHLFSQEEIFRVNEIVLRARDAAENRAVVPI